MIVAHAYEFVLWVAPPQIFSNNILYSDKLILGLGLIAFYKLTYNWMTNGVLLMVTAIVTSLCALDFNRVNIGK